MGDVKESDWKKYSARLPMWRERYLAKQNARIARVLADPKKNHSERFWDALEEMEKEAKTLRACLDRHSRSNMMLSLLSMRAVGMINAEDLADFSEELQELVLQDRGKQG